MCLTMLRLFGLVDIEVAIDIVRVVIEKLLDARCMRIPFSISSDFML